MSAPSQTSPTKSWQIPVNSFRSAPISDFGYSTRNTPVGVRNIQRPNMSASNEQPPPTPPPRPARQTNALSNYGGNGGYNSYNYGGYQPHYGGYSGGMYGGYGGHNGMYGGYNSMYGGYNGQQNQPTSSFVEQAEQNSRVAFDSIHSIVQAFGSISMMFESTFFAVHSSFRAVLGVADHFSRLRTNLVQAIGSNFLIKWIKSIVRKIMVLIGARNPAGAEEIWSEVRSAAMGQTGAGQRHAWRSWPLLLFFGVILGTPWLIWKFLCSLGDEVDQHKSWMTGTGDHVLGKALYDFVGEREDELTFCAGDCLKIAPKNKQPRMRGWLLATIDGTNKGIVPANYIKILGLKRTIKEVNGSESADAAQIPSTEQELNEQSCEDIETPLTTDLGQEYLETNLNSDTDTINNTESAETEN